MGGNYRAKPAFFPLRSTEGQLEMRYRHSASVVCELQSNLEAQETSAKARELAFFDKNGRFYDHVTLRGLELALGGEPQHTAHFESYNEEGQGEISSVAAGEIYSLFLSYNESEDLNL